jgi:hypothetical protein
VFLHQLRHVEPRQSDDDVQVGLLVDAEVALAGGDTLNQVINSDHVGARSRLDPLATANTTNAGGLTGAVRQVDGATHHLIRLERIHTKTNSHLDVASCSFGDVSLAKFTASNPTSCQGAGTSIVVASPR